MGLSRIENSQKITFCVLFLRHNDFTVIIYFCTKRSFFQFVSKALYRFNNNKTVSCFDLKCLTLKIINIKKLAINNKKQIIVKTHY